MADNMNYSGALLDMLDRDTQTTTKLMCYPITRIELLHADESGKQPQTFKIFVVDDSGHWTEAN